MQVAVFGAGRVGLVCALALARAGHAVTCFDHDEVHLARLNAGRLPFKEPHLDSLLLECMADGHVRFQRSPPSEPFKADITFIAVPTPLIGGRLDAAEVEAVGILAAVNVVGTTVLAIKSTVPPGTCAQLQRRADDLAPGRVHVVANPEFLREGHALHDFQCPDRVVIGAEKRPASLMVRRLYLSVVSPDMLFVQTNWASAELIKLASNAMLAMRVSFINEMTRLCESVGALAADVRTGVVSDHRIGVGHMNYGPGYGGPCLPKDVAGLAAVGLARNVRLPLIEATCDSNEAHLRHVVGRIVSACGGSLADRRIAVWGLAFKSLTDDVSGSPAQRIIEECLGLGAEVTVHDPSSAGDFARRTALAVSIEVEPILATVNADVLIVLNNSPEYESVDLDALRKAMRRPAVYDCRGIWATEALERKGFTYFSLGTAMPLRIATKSVASHSDADPVDESWTGT